MTNYRHIMRMFLRDVKTDNEKGGAGQVSSFVSQRLAHLI